MSGGTETTTAQFDPNAQGARNQQTDFLNSIFGQGGAGLGDLGSIFGGFGAQASPLQRQATNQLGQFLGQTAPEQQVFDQAFGGNLGQIAQGQGQFGNVAEALTPIFNRNLSEGISQLGSAAPGRFGSAFLQQGTNLGQRSLQDFNLFIEQARQQDVQNQIQASLGLGTLASAAGNNPFQRALGAGQFAQQGDQFASQQQFAMQQFVLQMLQGAGSPTGQQITSTPGLFDFLQLQAQVGGAAAGGAFG